MDIFRGDNFCAMKREKIVILPQLNDCNGDLNEKWFVYYSYRNPKSGKMERIRDYKGLHSKKTLKERYEAANKKIDELKEKLQAGWSPLLQANAIYSDELQYSAAARVYGRMKAGNINFNYYASEFLRNKLSGLDEATISTYKSRLRLFSMWLNKMGYNNIDVTAISNTIILEFFKYLIVDQQLSGNTTGKYKQLLQRVFDYVIEQKKLKINPVFQIPKNSRINDMTPRPINDADIEAFKTEIRKDQQLYLAIQFEYYCFLRPGKEIRLLQLKWIDFTRGLVTVPKSISKTKTDKILIIPNSFLLELRELGLHNLDKSYYLIGKNGVPGPEHIGKNNLRHRFVKIRKALNMPEEYKLYSWKHTGNVRADDAKIPLSDRQHQNGHSSARTTEVYTKNKKGHESVAIRENFPEL